MAALELLIKDMLVVMLQAQHKVVAVVGVLAQPDQMVLAQLVVLVEMVFHRL